MHRCKDGRRRPAYKPSVLAHECGLIVSQVVEVSNESAAIPELLDQYAAVFGAAPRTLLLDAGYHNIDVLTQIAARQIDVLCPSGSPVEGALEAQGNQGEVWQDRLCVRRRHRSLSVSRRAVVSARRDVLRTQQRVGCPQVPHHIARADARNPK